MIGNAATHRESGDNDGDDDGDRTVQRALVADGVPFGGSLLAFPLVPLPGNKYRGWGAARLPGMLTGVRALVAGRTVG